MNDKETFRTKVFKITSQIPKGQTLTYKQVAIQAGNPKSARAVGAILKTNFDPEIPCHRVIKSDGQLGGYNRGSERKLQILTDEKAI